MTENIALRLPALAASPGMLQLTDVFMRSSYELPVLRALPCNIQPCPNKEAAQAMQVIEARKVCA